MPSTLLDKIWSAHEVAPGLIYIDLHLVHEVTSPQAFEGLRLAGRTVRRPDRTLATADHNVPTDGTPRAAAIIDELSRVQVQTLEPRTAPLVRSPSASGRARSSTCWPRSVSCRQSHARCGSATTARVVSVSPQRT
jgi:hypothetical protein